MRPLHARGLTKVKRYPVKGRRIFFMTQTIPETPAEFERTRTFERPDGFYWQEKDGGREYGPFATLLEAVQDMQGGGEQAPEPGETLAQAEDEIGIADYVDPDTGEPAEEQRPRLEDH